MKTILEILQLATSYLAEHGVPHPRRQAEELLAEVLAVKRLQLYCGYDKPLQGHELEKCRSFFRRRAQGEPLEYIIGHTTFSDCRLALSRDVLIPRQETELLVEFVIQQLQSQGQELEGKMLLDLCCGSGYIGLAIKKRLPMLDVVLSDISPAAVLLASQNAEANGLSVTCLTGDLLAPFAGRRAHFVVCNPPYISEGEFASLEREVRCFEPYNALVSGPSGLEFFAALAQQLPLYLYSKGCIWFEIGATQGPDLLTLFASWDQPCIHCDLSEKNRFFSASLP